MKAEKCKNLFLSVISHAKPFLLHTKMTLTQVQPFHERRMYHCIINSFDMNIVLIYCMYLLCLSIFFCMYVFTYNVSCYI